MSKYDFSRNAYKAGPKHVIVETTTRREVARVHHEEDLQTVLKALQDSEKREPYAYTYVHIDGRRDWRMAQSRRLAEFGWTEPALYV